MRNNLFETFSKIFALFRNKYILLRKVFKLFNVLIMDTKKIETVLANIQDARKTKGFTLENMADELNISHSAYRKIENNQSKLTVERLMQIAVILETSANELLNETQTRVYNQNNNGNCTLIGHQEYESENGTVIGHQEFENYYQDNKELAQNHVADLREEIAYLKSNIEFLRMLLKQ